MRAGNRGFTLFELLLVLFIVGLAATFVMFSGSRMQEKSVFNAEARRLYLTVKHARELSILERRDIVFKVDGEAGKYWLVYGDDTTTSDIHTIPQKFILSGGDIIFFPKGNSTGGAIDLDNGKGQKYEVAVDMFGTPSIKRL